jgi:hypothetical protein
MRGEKLADVHSRVGSHLPMEFPVIPTERVLSYIDIVIVGGARIDFQAIVNRRTCNER